MTQEAKTEAERLAEIYAGLESGNGNVLQDIYPLLLDMVRRIKQLESELEDVVSSLVKNTERH